MTRVRRRASILIIVVAIVADGTSTAAGTQGTDRTPTGVSRLPAEQRATLEPAVAAHLASLEASLETLVRDGADAARLAEAFGALGQAFHAYTLTGPARASYEEAARRAPKDFRWAYLIARTLQQEDQVDAALAAFATARTLGATYAPLDVHVGHLLLSRNQMDDAIAAFERARAVDETKAAAAYGLGQAAMSRRDHARAAEYFRDVLSRVPDATRVHYALGLAYRGLGRTAEAQAQLALAGAVGVRVPDPLVDDLAGLVQGARLSLLRGRLAYAAGRQADALEAFRRAVDADPSNVPARVNLGSVLAQSGDAEGAVDQLERALTLDPDNPTALYNLAAIDAARNRLEAAVARLQRLTRLTPDDDDAYLLLGRTLQRLGRLDESLQAVAHVSGGDAGNEEAVLMQADLLSRLDRHREAVEVLDRSHAADPTRGRTAAQLAYLLATSADPAVRDPARALDLARRVYVASGEIRDGGVVVLALAGLGRCDEAASWQRELVAAAERDEPTRVAALRTELDRAVSTCRGR